MIAICLLTCDRLDYTRQTLETLTQHNDLSRFQLIHGDDSSRCRKNHAMARDAGFRTIVQSTDERQGVASMTERLFRAAAAEGATAVLNLQNDWECKRAIPVDDLEQILLDPDVYCVRLYGAFKSARGRCGIHHGGREPRTVVEWSPYALGGYESGDIHWGHPPAVTLIREALAMTHRAGSESVSRKRSGALSKLTVRVIENVFSHIGHERTPGFVS